MRHLLLHHLLHYMLALRRDTFYCIIWCSPDHYSFCCIIAAASAAHVIRRLLQRLLRYSPAFPSSMCLFVPAAVEHAKPRLAVLSELALATTSYNPVFSPTYAGVSHYLLQLRIFTYVCWDMFGCSSRSTAQQICRVGACCKLQPASRHLLYFCILHVGCGPLRLATCLLSSVITSSGLRSLGCGGSALCTMIGTLTAPPATSPSRQTTDQTS